MPPAFFRLWRPTPSSADVPWCGCSWLRVVFAVAGDALACAVPSRYGAGVLACCGRWSLVWFRVPLPRPRESNRVNCANWASRTCWQNTAALFLTVVVVVVVVVVLCALPSVLRLMQVTRPSTGRQLTSVWAENRPTGSQAHRVATREHGRTTRG